MYNINTNICKFVQLPIMRVNPHRFIMAELLQTERAYVKDLETCITCYLREMRTDPGAVPPALQGKVCLLFIALQHTCRLLVLLLGQILGYCFKYSIY